MTSLWFWKRVLEYLVVLLKSLSRDVWCFSGFGDSLPHLIGKHLGDSLSLFASVYCSLLTNMPGIFFEVFFLLMVGRVCWTVAYLCVSTTSSSSTSKSNAAACFVSILPSSSSSSSDESSWTSVIRGLGSYSQVFSLRVINAGYLDCDRQLSSYYLNEKSMFYVFVISWQLSVVLTGLILAERGFRSGD